MEIFQRMRLLMKEILIQAELHGRLFQVEWLQEKNRIQQIICIASLGFAFLLCSLLSLGFFVIAANWAGEYRMLSIAMVCACYLIGLIFCWVRFNALAAKGVESFAATREEFSADIALIRSQL
jgi:uncharacterized membrane protein YqjE